MRAAALVFAFLAAAGGAVSAYYWWRSSKIDVALEDMSGMPTDVVLGNSITATWKAFKEASTLNATAAMASAISMVCAAASAGFSYLAP